MAIFNCYVSSPEGTAMWRSYDVLLRRWDRDSENSHWKSRTRHVAHCILMCFESHLTELVKRKTGWNGKVIRWYGIYCYRVLICINIKWERNAHLIPLASSLLENLVTPSWAKRNTLRGGKWQIIRSQTASRVAWWKSFWRSNSLVMLQKSSKIELNFVDVLNLEKMQCHAMSCPVLAKPQVRTCFAPELPVFRHNSFGRGSLAQEDFKRARAEFEPAPKWSHTWHMSLRELCTFMILSCLFTSCQRWIIEIKGKFLQVSVFHASRSGAEKPEKPAFGWTSVRQQCVTLHRHGMHKG